MYFQDDSSDESTGSDEIQEKLEEAEAANNALKRQLIAELNKVTKLTVENEELKADAQLKDAEISDLNLQIKVSQYNEQNADKTNLKLKRLYQETKTKLVVLQENREVFETRIKELTARVADITKSELGSLEDLEKKKYLIADLDEKVKGLEKEMDRLQEKFFQEYQRLKNAVIEDVDAERMKQLSKLFDTLDEKRDVDVNRVWNFFLKVTNKNDEEEPVENRKNRASSVHNKPVELDGDDKDEIKKKSRHKRNTTESSIMLKPNQLGKPGF